MVSFFSTASAISSANKLWLSWSSILPCVSKHQINHPATTTPRLTHGYPGIVPVGIRTPDLTSWALVNSYLSTHKEFQGSREPLTPLPQKWGNHGYLITSGPATSTYIQNVYYLMKAYKYGSYHLTPPHTDLWVLQGSNKQAIKTDMKKTFMEM